MEYPHCNDSVQQKNVFGLAFLGKKLGFHTELFEFREKGLLKIGFFYRVKALSKSNQTRYGVSPVQWEYKAKSIFGLAWLGKKLGFHTELFEFREKEVLKIGFFSSG